MVSKALVVAAAASSLLAQTALAAPSFSFAPLSLFQDQVDVLAPPPSALPAPKAGLKLKAVALGLGTQNYTCKGSGSDAPKANGAVAVLYDATPAVFVASKLPSQADAPQRISCDASKLDRALMPRIGSHWFSAALVPTFDLSDGTKSKDFPDGLFMSAKVDQRTPAPQAACKGRDGQAAVPWLLLNDDGRGVSRGITEGYRVETVGGSAPSTCQGLPADFTHDYSALYYFYGP